MPGIRKFGRWHLWVRTILPDFFCDKKMYAPECSVAHLFVPIHFYTTSVVSSFSLSLVVIAHKSTSAEIGILRKIFQQYDTEGKGHLNYEQFKAAIADSSFQEEDYRRIFDAVVRIIKMSLAVLHLHIDGLT